MGYTTNWDFDPTHPNIREGWGRLVLDTKTIIETAANLDPAVIVCGPLGDPTTAPELSEGHIAFNGPRWGWREHMGRNDHASAAVAAADVAAIAPAGYVAADDDESCETFSLWLGDDLPRKWAKTNRNRYDMVVKAVLLRGHDLLGDALVPDVWNAETWETEWAAPLPWCEVPVSAVELVTGLFGCCTTPPFEE